MRVRSSTAANSCVLTRAPSARKWCSSVSAPSDLGQLPPPRALDSPPCCEPTTNSSSSFCAMRGSTGSPPEIGARRFRTVGRPDAWRNVVQMGLPGDWAITRWLAKHRSAPERGRPRVPRLTWRFPERPFLGTARVPRLRYVAVRAITPLGIYGGYCFLNNAAIAAQFLRDHGAERVAVLDVDFHHGNGTQDIFYSRSDVLYVSLHGDPSEAFPHFSGFADEAGADAGEGYNINFRLPRATGFGLWQQTLATALAGIGRYSPDALVVSLGVDTFVRDPISFFRLESGDFSTYGGMIGACRIPTLFVFEGGYAVADVGVNVVNVLAGFEDV